MVLDPSECVSLDVETECHVLQSCLCLWQPFLLKEQDSVRCEAHALVKRGDVLPEQADRAFDALLIVLSILQDSLCGLMRLLLPAI